MRRVLVAATALLCATTACSDGYGYEPHLVDGRLSLAVRTDDPEVLHLSFQSACVHDLEADESDSEVRIDAMVDNGPLADCIGPTVLTLDGPLGDRVVVDADTGEDVEVWDPPVETLGASLVEGPRELELSFACGVEVTRLEVDQHGRNRVFVDARGTDSGTTDQCLITRTVTLDEPLGRRRVVDAYTEEEFEVTRPPG